jgi:hypothetical protein
MVDSLSLSMVDVLVVVVVAAVVIWMQRTIAAHNLV